MISLDIGNTKHSEFSTKQNSKIIENLILKRDDLGFIDVDKTVDTNKIKEFTEDIGDDFDNIAILGIGGSALGTKALLESLYGKYYNETKDKKGKNIYVLDNIDPETFHDIERVIDIKKTLFIFISKSGGTIETLSEYIYFRGRCQQQVSNWKKHFCFIVGENCRMKDELEKDFKVFYIPENIGGRFSVFTAVGLLPLAFAGVDIDGFINGVSEAKEQCLSTNLDKNTALSLAYTQHEYYKNGKNICVFFPYSSRLFQVGEWYKQLMGESIGKSGEGITLTSSLGVTDQHSQLQLYQDGPADKLFLTLGINDLVNDRSISDDIEGLSFHKLLKIEEYGTTTSLKNEDHPVINLSLEKLDEKHIAGLLYTFMFQIAYLGELFDINAFDQPGVEKSKIITKEKLTEEFGDINMFNKAFYD